MAAGPAAGVRRLFLALAASIAISAVWAAGAQAFIYWTSFQTDSIGRANVDGTAVDPYFIAGATLPSAVAVDAQHIYWANLSTGGGTGSGSIARANLDGTGVNETFITGVGQPTGVAVGGGYIYWTDQQGNRIGRADLDGTNVIPSWDHSSGISTPSGIAYGGGKLYWTNQSGVNNGGLAYTATSGGGANTQFFPGTSTPAGPAVDSQFLYWANSGDGTIARVTLSGSNKSTLVSGIAQPSGVAVDAASLYWSSAGSNAIGKANLDGTGANQALISGVPAPNAIAVDGGAAPPATKIILTPPIANGLAGWWTVPVHATVTAFGFNPVAEIRCAIDPATPPATFAALPPGGCAYAGTGADVLADGLHTLYAAAADDHGGQGGVVSVHFTLDRTPPVLTCLPRPTFAVGKAGGQVTATVEDDISGPAQFAVAATVSTLRAGAGTVPLRAGDIAGNTTTISCPYIVKAPTIPGTLAWRFAGPTRAHPFTTIDSLVASGLPGAALMVIDCSGHGCPLRSRSVSAPRCPRRGRCTARGAVRLSLASIVRGLRFPAGTTLSVTFTGAGYTTKVYAFRMGRRGQPRRTVTCPADGPVPAGC